MNKIRLFVDHTLGEAQSVPLNKDQAHYIFSVMRKRIGDLILIFDGNNGEWLASINEISKQISKARTKQISIINQSVFNKIHIFFLNKSEIFTSKLKAYSVDFSKNSSVRNIYVSSTRIFIDLIFLLIVFFIFNSANLISDNFNGSEISFIVLSIFKILPSLSSLMSSVTNFRTSEYSLDELNKLLLIKKEPLKEAANRKA